MWAKGVVLDYCGCFTSFSCDKQAQMQILSQKHVMKFLQILQAIKPLVINAPQQKKKTKENHNELLCNLCHDLNPLQFSNHIFHVQLKKLFIQGHQSNKETCPGSDNKPRHFIQATLSPTLPLNIYLLLEAHAQTVSECWAREPVQSVSRRVREQLHRQNH